MNFFPANVLTEFGCRSSVTAADILKCWYLIKLIFYHFDIWYLINLLNTFDICTLSCCVSSHLHLCDISLMSPACQDALELCLPRRRRSFPPRSIWVPSSEPVMVSRSWKIKSEMWDATSLWSFNVVCSSGQRRGHQAAQQRDQRPQRVQQWDGGRHGQPADSGDYSNL